MRQRTRRRLRRLLALLLVLLLCAGCGFFADVYKRQYQMSVPRAQAAVLSVVKAQAVAQQYPLSIVIGADTVVELDGVMMGKPKDEAQAREMLTALSDKTHTVHTGIALCCRGEVFSDVVSSRVTFRALEPEEIDRYIDVYKRQGS